MNNDLKQKITQIEEDYRKIFSEEYNTFLDAQRYKKESLRTKWAEVEGSDFIVRGLTEVPETLYVLFKRRLDDDEFQWYNSLEGKKWFGSTFPAYLMTEKI